MVRRIFNSVRDDLHALVAVLRGRGLVGELPRGLQSYDFEVDERRTRLHLRLQDDGSAVLFRDVSDVIHLSDTAAELCWMALEGFSLSRALARLSRRYAGVRRGDLERDYRRMQSLVSHLARDHAGCSTCGLELPRYPLFSTRAKAPHKVDLALTYRCNNRCPHCYNEAERLVMDSLETAQWRQVLDRLAEIGVPHVIFTGGEATLHPGLAELIRHANQLGQICGLNSNGRCFGQNPALAEELAQAGLNHLQVTLHSHLPEVHDAMVAAPAFQQTVSGLRTALASQLHVITNTTITRLNAEHLEATLEFLEELGLGTFAMNGMIYSGGGDLNPDAIPQDHFPPILVRVRDKAAELGMRFIWYTVSEYCRLSPLELEIGAKRCNAGEYSLCIEPNGDVIPCQSYYASAGNILRDDWQSIWQSDLFRSFRHREEEPWLSGLPDKCRACMDLPLCGSGCRLERESKQREDLGENQSCSKGGCVRKFLRSTGLSARPNDAELDLSEADARFGSCENGADRQR